MASSFHCLIRKSLEIPCILTFHKERFQSLPHTSTESIKGHLTVYGQRIFSESKGRRSTLEERCSFVGDEGKVEGTVLSWADDRVQQRREATWVMTAQVQVSTGHTR